MRTVPNYYRSYTFIFIFIFFVLILFPAFCNSANTLSATESLTISSKRTIISPTEIFELGFFNPASSSRWYLGIWYKKFSPRTYVWVANRDNPLSNSNGILKISDNNLVISDQSDRSVWSTNLTGVDVRSPVTRGFPEYYVCNKESIMYRSGPWNGIRFSGIPEMKLNDYLAFNLTASNEEVTYSYRITKTNIYSRLILNSEGLFQRFTWIEKSQSWNLLWFSPKDLCNSYKHCGNYSYCDSSTSPNCNCIKGFKPRNEQALDLRDDSDGCVRKTKLSCDGRDGFMRLKKIKLPDTTETIVDRGIGSKECKERCLKDCKCTAFATMNISKGGSGCVIWNGELLDIRNYAKEGQDLYVRLAAADLVDKRTKNGKIIGSSIGVSILLLVSCIIFGFWKRKHRRSIAIQTPIVDQVRRQDQLMNEVTDSSSSTHRNNECTVNQITISVIDAR
ncbi:unnamed protein product, partial [Thlaspi arvense]